VIGGCDKVLWTCGRKSWFASTKENPFGICNPDLPYTHPEGRSRQLILTAKLSILRLELVSVLCPDYRFPGGGNPRVQLV
jgi:hypothetical protein